MESLSISYPSSSASSTSPAPKGKRDLSLEGLARFAASSLALREQSKKKRNYVLFCQPSHPYKSKLLTGAPSTKNAALSAASFFALHSAESEGFEPPEPFSSTVFKTAAIDHSANSPSPKGLQR